MQRLWGFDTQKGISTARVLILGVNGLANEIAKNLVLAGINHVCIQDTGTIDESALSSGGVFSYSAAQAGTGKAEALAKHLKEMNPSVDLVSTREEVRDLTLELLQSYHYIVGTRGNDSIREVEACTALLERRQSGENADPQSTGGTGEPAPKRQRANGDSGPPVARSNGTHEVAPMRQGNVAGGPPLPKFLAAGTIGLHGFCFFDLGAPTAVIPPPKKNDDDKPAASSSSSAPPPAAPRTEQALYPTVASAARVEWASLTPRVPPLYYGLQLLHAATRGGEHPPSAKGVAEAAAAALGEDSSSETLDLLTAMLRERAGRLEHAASNTTASKELTDAYLAVRTRTPSPPLTRAHARTLRHTRNRAPHARAHAPRPHPLCAVTPAGPRQRIRHRAGTRVRDCGRHRRVRGHQGHLGQGVADQQCLLLRRPREQRHRTAPRPELRLPVGDRQGRL